MTSIPVVGRPSMPWRTSDSSPKQAARSSSVRAFSHMYISAGAKSKKYSRLLSVCVRRILLKDAVHRRRLHHHSTQTLAFGDRQLRCLAEAAAVEQNARRTLSEMRIGRDLRHALLFQKPMKVGRILGSGKKRQTAELDLSLRSGWLIFLTAKRTLELYP